MFRVVAFPASGLCFLIVLLSLRDRNAVLRRYRLDNPADIQGPELPRPTTEVIKAARAGWDQLGSVLRSSRTRYVVVDAKNGLGNRLRALASGMAVSARLGRPLVLIWVADLHCNCSFRSLFAAPLPFALCESEIDSLSISPRHFKLYNYMRPEPGAIKDEYVEVDGVSVKREEPYLCVCRLCAYFAQNETANEQARHLWFKSGFVMNHRFGPMRYAQWHMQQLRPNRLVAKMLVANRSMVGLHIRNVFDAPRDSVTNKSTTSSKALHDATKEYGSEGTRQLLRWRKAGHWSNFLPKIREMVHENDERRKTTPGTPQLRFYLAADAADAYLNLRRELPNRLVFTERSCPAERCDFRDCMGMLYSLIDLFNLARTHLILGSGWSSYSEIAAYMGGVEGRPISILMAGRDFGQLDDAVPHGVSPHAVDNKSGTEMVNSHIS